MQLVIAAITTEPSCSSTSSPSSSAFATCRCGPGLGGDLRDLGVHRVRAGLLERGRVAGREAVLDALVDRAVAVAVPEARERVEERVLRLGQRHAVLRAARAGEARLDRGEVELDHLRVLGLDRLVVPEQVLLAVGLDERRPAPRAGRSGAGRRASGRRPGRSRRSRRTRATCSRASRGRPARGRPGPGPKYSTNLPTTPVLRSSSVIVSTRSVAVAPSRRRPSSRTPTTCGTSIESSSPSSAASASIPPTPQPSTPRPLTIVVCESVPTSVSGNATPSRSSTTRARYSRLTWWTMPVFGGTTFRLSKAPWPQRRKA